jgi:L-ribulokinase
MLTGATRPDRLRRGICAAGHKGMFNPAWGGYPDEEFLAALNPRLVPLRRTLPDHAGVSGQPAGGLCREWADRLGLIPGVPVAIGIIDAHSGAIGSGIAPGVMVKILGTSTCDMMVAPLEQDLPEIPGLCGIVPESILPGHHGLEAGQSAVGDIFNWLVRCLDPRADAEALHARLAAEAAALRPGATGLLALDWHNGNRTVLVDQRLTGGLIGMTLHTTAAEIYRALIEATAFGARVIIERFEEYGVHAGRIINCGGIPVKNPLLMQIYADVLGRPMEISRSDQTCALGAAICGAVAASKAAGGHADFAAAQRAMTGVRAQRYLPDSGRARTYDRLFALYRRLHDAFGVGGAADDLADVMKALLQIRDEAVRG